MHLRPIGWLLIVGVLVVIYLTTRKKGIPTISFPGPITHGTAPIPPDGRPIVSDITLNATIIPGVITAKRLLGPDYGQLTVFQSGGLTVQAYPIYNGSQWIGFVSTDGLIRYNVYGQWIGPGPRGVLTANPIVTSARISGS